MKKINLLFLASVTVLFGGCAFKPNGFLLDRLSSHPNPTCVNVFVDSTICSDATPNTCGGVPENKDVISKIKQEFREKINGKRGKISPKPRIDLDIPDKKLLKKINQRRA